MKKHSTFFYIAIITALLAIPFLWLSHAIIDRDTDANYKTRIILSEIRQREAEISMYLLRSRSHLDLNYDQLAQAQNNMSVLMETFTNKFVVQFYPMEMEQAEQVYSLYKKRSNAVERFKTLHAKLSNSLRFLPKLHNKIATEFPPRATKHHHEIVDLSNVILNQSYNLRLFGDEDILASITANIELLKTLANSSLTNVQQALMSSFILHAQKQLVFRQKENSTLQILLDKDFEQQLSALALSIQKRYLQEETEAKKTGQYLLAYSAFLFLLILIFIFNRHHLLKSITLHQTLSEKDSLTGLSNRRHFIQKLQGLLNNKTEDNLNGAIIFIDLDGFKAVNDTLGHTAGDEILQKISLRLLKLSKIRNHSDINQFAARLGGDEFVILLDSSVTNKVSMEIDSITAEILQLCSKPYGKKFDQLPISASLGVVCFPQHGNDITELLHFADLAMYEAKKQGKNCCHYHTP